MIASSALVAPHNAPGIVDAHREVLVIGVWREVYPDVDALLVDERSVRALSVENPTIRPHGHRKSLRRYSRGMAA